MSKRHRPLVVLLALVILGSWAGAALAQEEVQTTSKAAPAAARPPVIPLGQAQQTTAGQAMVQAPLSNEEKALLAIQEEGRQQVLALMRTLEGMSAGPERLAMEKKIAQVKQDYWIKMLRTKVDFARARGDFKAAQDGEIVIDNILHPRQMPAAAATPAPEKIHIK